MDTPTTNPTPPDKPAFNVGDAVYYNPSTEIGIISNVTPVPDGFSYRVNYCQHKDLAGPRGGNGPVWVKGYPKPVTDPADVLYVQALRLKQKTRELKKELESTEADLAALIRARVLISPKQE